MAAAIAVVMGLGVTAMAEEMDGPSASTSIQGESQDDSIIVEVYDCTLTSEQTDKISAFHTDDTTPMYCDIRAYLKSTGEEVTQFPDGLKVEFTISGADEIVKVYVWNGAGWDDASVSGKTVTFSHLCPVTFLVKKAASSTDTSTNKSSAQTGYDGLVYIVSAAFLAAGAGYFFCNAKKRQSA